MAEFIKIDPEESIAAVHWQGRWRFVYDIDIMFLLDYPSYDDTYFPKEEEFRYGTLIVDESNVEQWLASMSGELTTDQIPYARWEKDEQVKLTFVIDFDTKLWVGLHWQNDQSAYQDYQPDGWIAIEEDIFKYLPPDISNLWAEQLIKDAYFVAVNNWWLPLIHPDSRAGWWGRIRRPVRESIDLEIVRISETNGVKARNSIRKYMIGNDERADVEVLYHIEYNRDINLNIYLKRDGYIVKHIDTLIVNAP
jgi:hypothetical protein